MFEQCEFTSAVNADDVRMSLAQSFADCSSLHARLLAFAYNLKIESFWMELESGPSQLRNALEYGLDDTAPFFREISPKVPHHLRKIRPQHEMQSQTRRLCVPAAGCHRIKKPRCIFCDVIPRNEDKSRIQDRFPHSFHRLKMTDLLRTGPRHRK
jgi:hypothetical protein